ncbi:MAG: hypothetical protein KBE22_15870 [Candidatus Accumulibacter sp.]|nr:hypothetical protein [Accumulibacter sp.]
MWPFKCKHPARYLIVDRDETLKAADHGFTITTYHLLCALCNEKINISYAKTPADFWERED